MSQDFRYLLILSLSSSKSILLLTLLLQRLRGDGHTNAEKEHRLHHFRTLQAHQGRPHGVHDQWLLSIIFNFPHGYHASFNYRLTL